MPLSTLLRKLAEFFPATSLCRSIISLRRCLNLEPKSRIVLPPKHGYCLPLEAKCTIKHEKRQRFPLLTALVVTQYNDSKFVLNEVTSVVDQKRVQICIPAHLLDLVDSLAQENKINRSQVIQNCIQMYIMEKETHCLEDKLRVGYQIMADLNLTLAEEDCDDGLLDYYERQLAEAE